MVHKNILIIITLCCGGALIINGGFTPPKLGAATLSTTAAVTGIPPKLELAEKEFDFGTIPQHTKVTHIFKFKNSGCRVLEITRVKSTCGCTGALVSQNRLQPGADGELKVTFNSGSYRGFNKKTIYLHTNAPNQKAVPVVIKATVKKDTPLSADSIFFGMVKEGTTVSRTIWIREKGRKDLQIMKVVSNKDFITTKLLPPPKEAHEKGYQLLVTVTKDAPLGRFHDRMKIFTNIRNSPLLLPVSGIIAKKDTRRIIPGRPTSPPREP